ncbi:aminodeoxychorismate lyase [uncultured Aquitalea sp.]|uniref:aminodeoxychorismate lyase n=1 Tax=uncultured Aquitalea sp. TaxID=540272 RepID=UPI0025CBB5E0|nr:aminodeoxychorismate lyase [uncultured Aquitalea sp.]
MLINGQSGEHIAAQDRGLAYGDGVYRTLECRFGEPLLWSYQWARLAEDAARLRLPAPDEAQLLDELAREAGALPRAVAKIVLTRGVGARGYAIPEAALPTRIVSAAPWAGYPSALAEEGVRVRWCDTLLGCQPALAGIKHLNRLENVLARSEWRDEAIREGLMRDTRGLVIEGTMSNLFLIEGESLLTPRLDQNGVSGMARAWLLDTAARLGVPAAEADITPQRLLAADGLMLCNSLIGIWPVAALGSEWRAAPHPLCRHLQDEWRLAIMLK